MKNIPENDDIVLSSRVRLARNIDGYPFFLKDERAEQINKTVAEKLRLIDRFNLYRMSEFKSRNEALALMERHLISPDLIKNAKYGAVVVSDDERISVMLNEEDHIREQCILKGLSLRDAYDQINLIDRDLGSEFRFAFSPAYGYLTSCLTNVGTGMRASVMMFLPALTLTRSLEDCVSSVTRLNMAIRGVYGEGSDTSGYIYQISNQKTLGITEEDIIKSVENVAEHIIEAERSAREFLYNSSAVELKDKILRSYGTLTNCYKLNHGEFMNLIAFVKLGIYYGIFNKTDERLEDIIAAVQPSNLCVAHGKDMSGAERDVCRAEFIRKELKKSVKYNN